MNAEFQIKFLNEHFGFQLGIIVTTTHHDHFITSPHTITTPAITEGGAQRQALHVLAADTRVERVSKAAFFGFSLVSRLACQHDAHGHDWP